MNELQRRSIRLPDYDYTQDGAYFITLCTHKRECLFGIIDDQGIMQLNALGEIVRDEWLQSAVVRPYVILDEYVVMPNHFHAILFINQPENRSDGVNINERRKVPVGAQRAAPLRQVPHVVSQSLSAIVRGFKSVATKRINQLRNTAATPVWQRNYYEHVIRNESALNDIRSYNLTNPACWAQDMENPANISLAMRTYP